LKTLGVEAFYKPVHGISSTRGKIGGAAQKRLRDGNLLHHATIRYDIDADKMVEVLRVGEAKISDKGVASAKKRVDPLRSQTGESRKDIIDVMAETFASRYGADYGTYTEAELERHTRSSTRSSAPTSGPTASPERISPSSYDVELVRRRTRKTPNPKDAGIV